MLFGPIRSSRRNVGASYTLTVQRCGHDMKNPDSTWQQLPTILAGLNHNRCGVWSLDRLCGWLETKKLKSSPAVQQETPCWKCHRSIVHNHISHRWPRNLISAIGLQKILSFPRPWKAAVSHLTWHLGRMPRYFHTFPLFRVSSRPLRIGSLL